MKKLLLAALCWCSLIPQSMAAPIPFPSMANYDKRCEPHIDQMQYWVFPDSDLGESCQKVFSKTPEELQKWLVPKCIEAWQKTFGTGAFDDKITPWDPACPPTTQECPKCIDKNTITAKKCGLSENGRKDRPDGGLVCEVVSYGPSKTIEGGCAINARLKKTGCIYYCTR